MSTRRIPGIPASAVALAALVLLPGSAAGQEVRGQISLESRTFPHDALFEDQRDARVSPSLVLEPELLGSALDGDVALTLRPFLRLDSHDGERTHLDLREASALYFADGWTLFAGVGKVFWGKTEAHHLVDVVNQTDAVEDVDGEDKLGQPMVNLTLERSWGALDLFWLPYFRERTFAGDHGRLRGPLPVREEAVYESGLERWHPDVAVRWSHWVGNVDLAVSASRGTSREPRLTPAGPAGGAEGGTPTLVAAYDVIDQVSVEAQWTRGASLWKLEAMTRGGHGDRFAAAVLGLEHTLFGLRGGSGDLGLLAEVMVDGRGRGAPPTVFDHDVFAGARWAWNDEQDTSLLGGPVIDLETGETIAFVEAERRITGRWTVALEARWFANTDPATPLAGLRRDDFLTLRVSRHF